MVKANLVSLLFGSVLFSATFILLDRVIPFLWGYGSTRVISSNSLLISVIVSMTIASILLGLWKSRISPIFSLSFCSILYFIQAYISIKYNFIGVSATFVEGVSEFQKFATYFKFYVWKHSPIMTISLGMIILHITGRVRMARIKISV